MTLDYRTLRRISQVGNNLHVLYVDGKTVIAYPDGHGGFMPRAANPSGDPSTYDAYTPPVEPPAPGDWLANWAEGFELTSGYGMRAGGMHYGIDLSSTTTVTGKPVLAVSDMVVTVAVDAFEGGNSTAGTYVKGHTPDGKYTFMYCHGADESLKVAVGDTVTAGTQLFVEGQTGNVTGTHLHFEIIMGNWPNPWAPPYNNGAQFVDPLPILREHGVNI